MWQSLKELLVSFGDLFYFSSIFSVINPRKQQLVLEEHPAFGSRHSAATNYFENNVKLFDFNSDSLCPRSEYSHMGIGIASQRNFYTTVEVSVLQVCWCKPFRQDSHL